jgi:transposase
MNEIRFSSRPDAPVIETNTPDEGRPEASTIRHSPIPGSRVSGKTITEGMKMSNGQSDAYAALIGMDWASTKHDIWVWDAATGEGRHEVLAHTPEALAEWIEALRARYPGGVAVALEQSRGALIYALSGHAFLTLYPVNPVTLARYRGAFTPSRAKDDPGDARLLAEILRLHRDKLTAWKPDDERTRTLGFLNEERRKAVDLRTMLVLRLQAALRLYFPQAIDWVGAHLYHPQACDWLLRWPTLAAVQRAKPQTIRAFYYAHNARRADQIESRLQAIAAAHPLTRDAAVIAANQLTVKVLATQLRSLHAAILEYDRHIAELFREHPDAGLFDDLPGAGPALAPRLLCAFGTDRGRYPLAQDAQSYFGVAPVVERSGKHTWTHWRWNSPKFLRQTFHEFAKSSLPYCAWAKAYYDLQRQRGKGHHAAVRALAFKWVRVLHRCWRTRTPYDEQRYLDALKRRGSPIYGLVPPQPQAA